MNTGKSYNERVQRRKNAILGNAEILRLVKQYYNAEQRRNDIMKNLVKINRNLRNIKNTNAFKAAYAASRPAYKARRNNHTQARKNMYNAEQAIVKRARKVVPRRNLPVNAYFVFKKVMNVVPKNAKSPRKNNNNNNVFYNSAESLENMLRKGYRTMPYQPRPKNAKLNALYWSLKK